MIKLSVLSTCRPAGNRLRAHEVSSLVTKGFGVNDTSLVQSRPRSPRLYE